MTKLQVGKEKKRHDIWNGRAEEDIASSMMLSDICSPSPPWFGQVKLSQSALQGRFTVILLKREKMCSYIFIYCKFKYCTEKTLLCHGKTYSKENISQQEFYLNFFCLINNFHQCPRFYSKLTLRMWQCAMHFLPHNEADFAVTAITETQNPWGSAKKNLV